MAGKIKKRGPAPRRRFPLLNEGLGVRMVDDEAVVDRQWRRYRVWQVRGRDVEDSTVMTGWESFVSALDFPVQVLVRQHKPDLEDMRQKLQEDLPEYMRIPSVEDLVWGLDAFLEGLEKRGGVVKRSFYIVADAEREGELTGLLRSGGFRADLLEGEALRGVYLGCGSGMLSGHQRERYQMLERARYLQLNERRVRVYEVSEWPRWIGVDFIERLLSSGEELDLSLYVEPISQPESITRLRTQKTRWEGYVANQARKGHPASDDAEIALQDATRLLREAQVGVSRLYSLNLTVAAYGEDEESLKRACDEVESHFRRMEAVARPLVMRQREGFAQLMPALRKGVSRPLYRTDKRTVISVYPFGPPDLDTREGILLSLCLRSRSPVFYDRFGKDVESPHTLIVAPTGSGKSFDGKLIVMREVQRGVRGYVIDPSGEYANIIQALGGRVLEPGRAGYGLNPFSVRYKSRSELRDHAGQVCELVAMMLEDEVDIERRSLIDDCVMGWYEYEMARVESEGPVLDQLLGLGGVNDFHEYLSAGHKRDLGERLARLLQRFVTGTMSDLMGGDGVSLLDGEAPATSLTLRSVPESLMPVATAVCAQAVWSLAVADERRRLMLFDEIWRLLRTAAGTKLMMSLMKQARKYNLGIIAITQEPRDLLVSDRSLGLAGGGGESILANCYSKILLHHGPDLLPLLEEKMGLSPSGVDFLQKATRGQGLFIVGEEEFPVRFIGTPQERALIDDPSWRQHVDRFAENERALVAV